MLLLQKKVPFYSIKKDNDFFMLFFLLLHQSRQNFCSNQYVYSEASSFDSFWISVSNCCSILLFYSYQFFHASHEQFVAENLCRRRFSWWILRLALFWQLPEQWPSLGICFWHSCHRLWIVCGADLQSGKFMSASTVSRSLSFKD